MSTLYKIALTFLKNVGPITAKHLLAYCGSAEDIFLTPKSKLLKIPGIKERHVEAIYNPEALIRAEQELEFVAKHDIQVYFYTDESYPKRLKTCVDAPILLYFKGEANLNHPRIISVVGTRNATDYGKDLCKQLVESLKPYDVMVVSGLAYGIDVCTHKECLNADITTIGVLGHGLDRLYPKVHKSVSQKMIFNGGLLSEYPTLTNPDRQNFPQRNRIIAGISDVTIVVEASAKGGALITAEIANSYNRDVYAFPGRVDDVYAEGCNFLIKTNRAGLITQGKDLIYNLGWELEKINPKKVLQTSLHLSLSKEELAVVSILKDNSLAIDELSIQLQWPQSKIAIVLLTLEMQGIIVSMPGKIYKVVI